MCDTPMTPLVCLSVCFFVFEVQIFLTSRVTTEPILSLKDQMHRGQRTIKKLTHACTELS